VTPTKIKATALKGKQKKVLRKKQEKILTKKQIKNHYLKKKGFIILLFLKRL